MTDPTKPMKEEDDDFCESCMDTHAPMRDGKLVHGGLEGVGQFFEANKKAISKLDCDYVVGDKSPGLRGIYRLEAYYGDIKREAIPIRQRLWNAFANARWKLLHRPSDHYYWGRVLNEPAPIFNGQSVHTVENMVVTVGKELIMDRLYGLSSWAAVTQTGVGTSATGAAVGNTDLTGGVWKNFDATPIRTSLTVRSIVTFGTTEANISWNEMGQRSVSPSNKILSRVAPIGPFGKSAAVSIILNYDLVQA